MTRQVENGKLKPALSGIITGASGGIGRSLAVLLARKYQAQLVLNARTKSTLEKTGKLVTEAGGKAILVNGDMAEKGLPQQLLNTCLSNFGKVNLLVNNAGFARPGSVLKLTPEDWEAVFAVNFFAPLNTIYLVLPQMIQQGGGTIINISSVAGKVAFPGSVCYAASKFALTGMSEGMAGELANENIDVITVCPGWVRTEFFSRNGMVDAKNPSMIAEEKNISGWLMRNVLSISSESCAQDILSALEKGGSREIVLTLPGIFAERMHAIFPGLTFQLAKRMPSKYVDSSQKN